MRQQAGAIFGAVVCLTLAGETLAKQIFVLDKLAGPARGIADCSVTGDNGLSVKTNSGGYATVPDGGSSGDVTVDCGQFFKEKTDDLAGRFPIIQVPAFDTAIKKIQYIHDGPVDGDFQIAFQFFDSSYDPTCVGYGRIGECDKILVRWPTGNRRDQTASLNDNNEDRRHRGAAVFIVDNKAGEGRLSSYSNNVTVVSAIPVFETRTFSLPADTRPIKYWFIGCVDTVSGGFITAGQLFVKREGFNVEELASKCKDRKSLDL